MVDVETGRFTVGVFQDVAWAERGSTRSSSAGFVPESLTILAKESPEVGALIDAHASARAAIGSNCRRSAPCSSRGPLVEALQGASRDLAKLGLSGTMRRVGFQAHDGRIFEVLAGRGGVLVAIHSEPRAADALAVLHSYGGGNAAIGAWTGRV